jgi:hypothetical protein
VSLHLIAAPTDEVVTLEEAKAQLRITNNDSDELIRALIDSAVAQIDAAGGGWLGRALSPQTWELRLNEYPYGYADYDQTYWRCCYVGATCPTGTYSYQIELPYPPLISVDSVKHYDTDGVDTTLVENTDYRVVGLGSIGRASVAPIYNGSWPTLVRTDFGSVRVRFTAGYSAGVPAPIKQAVLLACRDLWSLNERNLYLRSESAPGLASYEWTVSEMAGKVIRSASESLLSTYRVYY